MRQRIFTRFLSRFSTRKSSRSRLSRRATSLNQFDSPFARRLRCEPLEDRRMLSITLFVDADATPSGDGLAWETAYADLQSALTQAAAWNADADTSNDVDAVWIAEGTYKPTSQLEPSDARSASFSLLNNVALYGGFVGTETTLAERDIAAHVTTLSGDIGVVDDSSDNAYTVVYCGKDVDASLDSMIITRGNADGSSSFSHHERSNGGGIFNLGRLKIAVCAISGNFASYGGGIINYPASTLTVIGCLISGNSALTGGGIDNGGVLAITNSTISGSTANTSGGIRNYGGTLTSTNTTITDNCAIDEGGGLCIYGSSSETILKNTVVAKNEADSRLDIILSSGTLSGFHNLIGDGSGQAALVNGIDGNIVGTAENPIDPMLDSLQDNGGPTFTHAPLPGSPLINAGIDTEATALLDQRGFLRRYETVDIGAVEYQPPGVPVAYSDGFDIEQDSSVILDMLDILSNDLCNDGSLLTVEIVSEPQHGTLSANLDGTLTYTPIETFWGNDAFSYRAVNGTLKSNVAEVYFSVISPFSVVVTTAEDEKDQDISSDDISLREALGRYQTVQIQFSARLFDQVIKLKMGPLNVSNVQIVGLGSPQTTIDGSGQGTVFNVIGGSSIISHLTIIGGAGSTGVVVATQATLLIDQAVISDNKSSAIYNTGTLSVKDSIISGNSAYSGGGVCNYNGEMTILYSTISGNSASYGGGIINYPASTLTVIGCLISGNSALTGGGIDNGGVLAITNSTISGNTANTSGGIRNYGGTLTITNTTITDNCAIDEGGGLCIYGSSSETILKNTVVAKNEADSRLDIILSSGTLSGFHNLIGDGSGQTALHNGIDGNIVGTAENPIDPCFINAEAGDFRLRYGSPAINAGNNALAVDADGNPLALDAEGKQRIIYGQVDIGAYEYRLTGDANYSGTVDQGDSAVLAAHWLMQSGADWSDGDFNGDGRVNDVDAVIMVANWGRNIPVAEPATAAEAAGNAAALAVAEEAGEAEAAVEETVLALLPGDANGDGTVDAIDSAVLASNWRKASGAVWADGDFNGDGRVDDADAKLLAVNWRKSQTASDLRRVRLDAPAAENNETPDLDPACDDGELATATLAATALLPATVALPGDANLDGRVNDLDAAALTRHWRKPSAAAWADGDFSGDGRVDELDLAILAQHWMMVGDDEEID